MKRILWVGLLGLLASGCTISRVDPADPSNGGPGTTCSEALQGTQPFGKRVSGDLEFTISDYHKDAGRILRDTLALDVYFPQGLAPNAPVVLAAQVYNGLHAEAGTLGANATGELAWHGIIDKRARTVTATIASDGVRVNVTENFAQWIDDVMYLADGEGRLCPAGSTPEPSLVFSQRAIGPLSRLSFDMTVPIDAASLAVQAATSAGPMSATATLATTTVNVEKHEAVDVALVGLMPPNEDLELEFTGLKDVLGRAVPGRINLPALKTTTMLSDLEFDTPTEGAIASSCESTAVFQGVLGIGGSMGSSYTWPCAGPQDLLIALPDPGAATQLELTFVRTTVYEPDQTFALIRSDGTFTKAHRGPDTASTSLLLDIPSGTGPLWLTAHLEFAADIPQYLPPPPQAMNLDRIAWRTPPPSSLDCSWFIAANNCWKTVIAPAIACLPLKAEHGAVAVGQNTCTYASGTTVTFDTPYSDQSTPKAFTLANSAGECLRYQRGANRRSLTVTTAAGTYVQASDGTTLSITCPGASLISTDFASLEACGDQTGLGLVFDDFLIPTASVVGESSASYSGIAYEMSPRPENSTGAPDDWQFTVFRCGHE